MGKQDDHHTIFQITPIYATKIDDIGDKRNIRVGELL